jgi:hypothetical protein
MGECGVFRPLASRHKKTRHNRAGGAGSLGHEEFNVAVTFQSLRPFG